MENFEKLYSNFRDSELIKNIKENKIENYPVYKEDLTLISHILTNEEVGYNIKNNLMQISSKIDSEKRVAALKKFSVNSTNDMEALVNLINNNVNDEVNEEFINWLINSNELTLFYLEEAGKTSKSQNYYFIRDILSNIKLSVKFDDFVKVLKKSSEKSLSYLKNEYLEDVRDEYLRIILPRIEEIEEIIDASIEVYIKDVENELISSPNLDIYQVITKYVDLIFVKLPTEKFPEYDCCPEEEFGDYRSVVEMMYTQFSLKLMQFSIDIFSKIG